MIGAAFSSRLIAWQRQYGRHHLPWQNTRDAYRIWISEVMLQQTQVATVTAYFDRFIRRFPDPASLARAPEDAVLGAWSGLGYYSRARHLQAAARIIVERHGGCFPHDFDAVTALPGVGRSTAAAITVFAFGARRAILDGNVKRVLARCFGIEGYPGDPAVAARLWSIAEQRLPPRDVETYTQALMDLGATLCVRGRPRCERCPLKEICVAYRDDRIAELPHKKMRKPAPQRRATLLLLLRGREVLLEKRPPTGVWARLWSFPELASAEDAERFCRQRYGVQATALMPWAEVIHRFTHYTLTITPLPLRVCGELPAAGETQTRWMAIGAASQAAIPAPVRKLLGQLPWR